MTQDTHRARRSRRPASTVLRNVQMSADMEAESSSRRTALDKLSDRVSAFAGSSSFLLIHLIWFVGWIVLNVRRAAALDPYPFMFLTFLVSLEAIFLTSIVLISQNHLEMQAHRRAALDLQINLLAEREMTSVLRKVTAIAAHLGVDEDALDADLTELIEQTDVLAVAKTVDDESKKT